MSTRRLSIAAVFALAACSHGDRSLVEPPPVTTPDTLTIPDPSRSPTPGPVRLNLVRSATSNLPAAAESVLVRVYNPNSQFNEIFPAAIPVPGHTTVVTAMVPADTGYVVALIAYHDNNTPDAVGSTIDNDTTITVFPAGSPTYTNTPVHVDLTTAPFMLSYSINDGTHVQAGSHIGWLALISTPRDIWTDANSTWGCIANGNTCSIPSYQVTVPNTLGPWLLETSFVANWLDHTFETNSVSIHVIVDQGVGGIDVSFNKHH
jgi:hypothetical protein